MGLSVRVLRRYSSARGWVREGEGVEGQAGRPTTYLEVEVAHLREDHEHALHLVFVLRGEVAHVAVGHVQVGLELSVFELGEVWALLGGGGRGLPV